MLSIVSSDRTRCGALLPIPPNGRGTEKRRAERRVGCETPRFFIDCMSATTLKWLADHALILWVAACGLICLFLAGASRSDGEGL